MKPKVREQVHQGVVYSIDLEGKSPIRGTYIGWTATNGGILMNFLVRGKDGRPTTYACHDDEYVLKGTELKLNNPRNLEGFVGKLAGKNLRHAEKRLQGVGL